MTSSSLHDTTGTLPDDGIVLMDHIRECVELAAQVRSAAPLQLVGHCLRYGRSAAAQVARASITAARCMVSQECY